MAEVKFILAAIFFLVFLAFIGQQIGTDVIQTDQEFDEIEAPECEIGGLDAPVDAIVCVVNGLGFFLEMTTVTSSSNVVKLLILTPIIIGIVWAVLSLIRGGS